MVAYEGDIWVMAAQTNGLRLQPLDMCSLPRAWGGGFLGEVPPPLPWIIAFTWWFPLRRSELETSSAQPDKLLRKTVV